VNAVPQPAPPPMPRPIGRTAAAPPLPATYPSPYPVRRPPVAIGLSLAIGLVAIALQVRYGLLGDVSWLITADEKWLDGQIPYRDFIEINPPASLLLYWPAVALARLVGVWPEFAVAAFGFLSIAGSLALSAAILRRAGLIGRVGPLGLGIALVALAILPGQSFDERDQLAAVYGMPFLAIAAARAARARVDWRMALLAGVGAGVMAAIKPPYALVAIALTPYLARRIGVAGLLHAVEFYAAAAVGLAYAALVALAFPHYVADILPLGLAVYAPLRESLPALLSEPGVLVTLVLGAALVQIAGRDIGEPLVAAPALGALGALAAYLVQGKGWLYQAYPALALMTVAAGLALDLRPQSPRRMATGALTGLAAAIALVWLDRWPLPIAFAAAAAASALLAAIERFERAGRARNRKSPLAEMGVAAAIGVACGLFAIDGVRTPVLARALASLGPHPTVLTISESLAFGHPMVRRVGGVWVQRVPSLWITSAVRRLIDEHPGDEALAARLRPYIDSDRDRLVEDIRRNRPDAILVGRLDTRFHQWAWSDPAITAARADYQLFAAEPGHAFPAELYVRKDLIGLRASLAGDIAREPDPAR
jgi:hypothetical protein